MCSVSAVYDYYSQRPLIQWTPQTYVDFQEIVRRLDALDKKLGDAECHDPAKAAWTKKVEARLAKIEAAKKPKRRAKRKAGVR